FNHTTPFSVAEKECEKGSELLMPFTTNILTISLHQHNLTKSQKKIDKVIKTLSYKQYRRPGSNRHAREGTGF
ncbi:hypothetical protein KG091_08725, partial [Carnobacteriaceae bacterium zg-ZUI78]|nr:hypothetical protein [Carnobacteriaceae bacterium zg-ZUI78]